MNQVTLFSNGIGYFRRSYSVQGKTSISIPFKTDFIGDVAASLQVFGNVRLAVPPTFTPANSAATALSIEAGSAMNALLRQVSGTNVKIYPNAGVGPEIVGTLLGLDKEEQHSLDGTVEDWFVAVLRDNGRVKRLHLQDVAEVEFLDDSVKAEIQKALKVNLQRIKPGTTLLELTLEPTADKAVEAVVQYTIPVAAWKMRYSIRNDKGRFALEGSAIIDNNTDEDWDNFTVSVVTGNPISFSTDIAHVVMPTRRMVKLVDDVALGNVDVAEGYVTAAMAGFAPAPTSSKSMSSRSLRAASLGPKMSSYSNREFGLESCQQDAAGDESLMYMDVAEAPGMDTKEVGDFSIFTSKESISLPAHRSAVVPMFNIELQHAGLILFYKEANHARRPFSAVKFKNEASFSLGRGKTVIYIDGVFAGECVLETAKPNDIRMLPHALENGVKIVREPKARDCRRNSLLISDGVATDEQITTQVTNYVVENKKDEAYKVAIEHRCALDPKKVKIQFEGVKVEEPLTLDDGYRVYFELAPKQSLTLKVTEVVVDKSVVQLGDFQWLATVVADNDSLAKDTVIQQCVKIQGQIDETKQALEEADAERKQLETQAERVRENLKAAGSSRSDGWIQDLDETEKAVRKYEKETVPSLKKKRSELRRQLQGELKKLSINWSVQQAE